MARACYGVFLAFLATGPTTARAQEPSWTLRLSGPGAAARLRLPQVDDRLQAAQTLGHRGSSAGAVEALSSALETEQVAAVRDAIVASLARRGGPRAVAALAKALLQAGWDRTPAVRVLGGLGSNLAISALLDALLEPELRVPAVEALARIGPAAVPALLHGLRRPASLAAVVEALGAIGDARATAALVGLVGHVDVEVARAAWRALGAIADPRARPAALAYLQALDDDSPEVASGLAQEALAVLAEVGTRDDMPALRRWFETGPAGLHAQALRTLTRTAPDLAPPLFDRALSRDPEHARAAVEIAIEVADVHLAGVLSRLCRERPEVAERALGALAALDGGAGVPALLALAGVERATAGGTAADLLRRAALREIAVALRRWHRDLPAAHRRAGRRLLQQGTGGREVERTYLLRGVARDPSVGPWLVRALRSPDPVRRAAAALGLEFLQAPSYARDLTTALATEQDPEAFRRMAVAATALGGVVSLADVVHAMDTEATAPEAMMLAAASASQYGARDRRDLGRRLRRALRATDARVRAAGAWALSRANERRAWRAVASLLDDPVVAVRQAAARALERMPVRRARPLLEARARVEPVAQVRLALHDAARARLRRSMRGTGTPGAQVLRLRIAGQPEGRGLPVDVHLESGIWHRMQTLASGELFLVDLPAGTADIQVRIAE